MQTSNTGSSKPRGELHAKCLRCKKLDGAIVMRSQLSARVFRVDGSMEDLGVISTRLVTDAFVAFVVDQLQTETSTFGDFKYHDSGTGVGAEAAGDTALGTPCGDARDAGTQIEGATGNIYKTVATHTYDEVLAITEHGVFNIDAAGTLMDRSVFGAINVASGDRIEFTYQITFSSGG